MIRTMIFVGLLLGVMLSAVDVGAEAVHTFSYVTYRGKVNDDPRQARVLNTFKISMGPMVDGQREVKYFEREHEQSKRETYIVGDQWQTLEWSVRDDISGKHYDGNRTGNMIRIKGRDGRKLINETIDIDDDPFYFNPKIGLQRLIESGQERMTFWGIRHDNLKVYKMVAESQGLETIHVNGESVEAVKIYWAAEAGFAKYFSRTYWFRQRDLMYVKQKSMARKYKVLVAEQ